MVTKSQEADGKGTRVEAHLRKVEALCALCSAKAKQKKTVKELKAEKAKVVGERAFLQQLTRESASSWRRYLRDPEHELVHCRRNQ
jgi:uncharacterized protein (DUF2147 family)